MTPTEITELLQRTFERIDDIKVGFTGTRRGMTSLQAETFEKLLTEIRALRSSERNLLGWPEFHHGDCVGSDAGARAVARKCGYRIVAHPPIDERLRAFCEADEVREAFEYRVRDRHIVEEVQLMLATPKFMREELRSGTWATIRDARRYFTPVIIVWSNGSSTVT